MKSLLKSQNHKLKSHDFEISYKEIVCCQPLDWNCAYAIGTSLNLDLLCVAQNGVVLALRRTAASQTATLASLQTNGLKGATTTKTILFGA